MTRESLTLNVVVAAGGILLGILGYRVMFAEKRNVKRRDEEESINEKPAEQASVEPSKAEIVDDKEEKLSATESIKKEIKEITYSTPEEFIVGVCKVLVKRQIKTREEFFNEVIKAVYFNVIDPGWIEKVPKTIEGLEKLLKEQNLWNEYLFMLSSSVNQETIKKSTRIGKRRTRKNYTYHKHNKLLEFMMMV